MSKADGQTGGGSTTVGESSHIRSGHDRIHRDGITEVSPDLAVGGTSDDDVEVAISMGQKMLSATTGSLLTSLLSKYSLAWSCGYSYFHQVEIKFPSYKKTVWSNLD